MNLAGYLRFYIRSSLKICLLWAEIHCWILTHITDVTMHRKTLVFLLFKKVFAASEYILKYFKC
jgi:hypothetical protein